MDNWNVKWKTHGNVYHTPEVNRPSATNEQLYIEGKKHYVKKAKLVILPFVSFAGKNLDKVRANIDKFTTNVCFYERFGHKNIFKDQYLISMDISVEVYDDWNTVEDYIKPDNYPSSLHKPDYMKMEMETSPTSEEQKKNYIVEQFFLLFIKNNEIKLTPKQTTNWYHCEAVWCSRYTPLTTFDSIPLGTLFHTVILGKFNPEDINRIRITFKIEKL